LAAVRRVLAERGSRAVPYLVLLHASEGTGAMVLARGEALAAGACHAKGGGE
jgi:hypothetical protein